MSTRFQPSSRFASFHSFRRIALGGVLLSALALAGPLTPPVGPVVGAGKTLQEVEARTIINLANTPGDANSLYRISQPGSYYLAGNITGVSGKHGIEIGVAGVTIDLNGFEVVGVAGSLDGIRGPGSNKTGLTILNGTVRNWGANGVNLANDFGGRIEGVHAYNNTLSGIVGTAMCAVSNSSAIFNDRYGFSLQQNGTLLNCSASNNDVGFKTGFAATITNCTSSVNSVAGFQTEDSSTMTNCAAMSNADAGFDVADGCSVIDCTATGNDLVGIRCQNACTIRGNTLYRNGTLDSIGAGIRTAGSQNRIEGNNCTNADFGIYVTGAGNVIIRNTCSTNTQNFVIGANNIHGVIVDRTAPGSPAVIGNAGAGTMGSTDPNANFAY